jgi:hypothetical protein
LALIRRDHQAADVRVPGAQREPQRTRYLRRLWLTGSSTDDAKVRWWIDATRRDATSEEAVGAAMGRMGEVRRAALARARKRGSSASPLEDAQRSGQPPRPRSSPSTTYRRPCSLRSPRSRVARSIASRQRSASAASPIRFNCTCTLAPTTTEPYPATAASRSGSALVHKLEECPAVHVGSPVEHRSDKHAVHMIVCRHPG